MPRNDEDTEPTTTPDNRQRRRDTMPTALALDCAAHRGLGFEPSLRPQSIRIPRERLSTAPNPLDASFSVTIVAI